MQSLRHLKDNKIVRWAFIAVLAILAAVSVYQGARNALAFSQDLQWDASKALAMRLDPYELSNDPDRTSEYTELASFYKMFTDKGLEQKMEANQFPSLLALLFPITVFEPETARVIWLILNLIFTAGIITLLKNTFFDKADGYGFAVAMLIMLAGTPYRNQLGVGQHTLFAFFFFMLAVWVEKTRPCRSEIANTLLAAFCLFVSYFKYTLTAPLALYFLYRKRYKELALSVGAHVILTGASALWLGKSFAYVLIAPLKVASQLGAEGGIDLGVIFGGKVSYVLAFLIAVALTVICIRMPEGYERILFLMLILFSLILTYHRTYDFFVLSAACAPFITEDGADKEIFASRKGLYTALYWVVTVFVYFILRVFNENTVSKVATGIFYYAFTLAIAWICIAGINKTGAKNGR
ncbi:MAG: DUF2029 domain-containing protein [Lachnospiraceae bacterium]|nr:DUF2029 domain-containing protein [Lachnospiraceae bacterium]